MKWILRENTNKYIKQSHLCDYICICHCIKLCFWGQNAIPRFPDCSTYKASRNLYWQAKYKKAQFFSQFVVGKELFILDMHTYINPKPIAIDNKIQQILLHLLQLWNMPLKYDTDAG